jgi:hypothetical protein
MWLNNGIGDVDAKEVEEKKWRGGGTLSRDSCHEEVQGPSFLREYKK